jgi:hypothetical protein
MVAKSSSPAQAINASGHGAWMHYKQQSPEENEKRIAELKAKAGAVFLPASSESKPN